MSKANPTASSTEAADLVATTTAASSKITSLPASESKLSSTLTSEVISTVSSSSSSTSSSSSSSSSPAPSPTTVSPSSLATIAPPISSLPTANPLLSVDFPVITHPNLPFAASTSITSGTLLPSLSSLAYCPSSLSLQSSSSRSFTSNDQLSSSSTTSVSLPFVLPDISKLSKPSTTPSIITTATTTTTTATAPLVGASSPTIVEKDDLQSGASGWKQNATNKFSSHKKRFRRTSLQIDRQYYCEEGTCNKSYGSWNALRTHLKIKHPLALASYIDSRGKRDDPSHLVKGSGSNNHNHNHNHHHQYSQRMKSSSSSSSSRPKEPTTHSYPVSRLEVGTWGYSSIYIGDLFARVATDARKFYWDIFMSSGKLLRFAIPFDNVVRIDCGKLQQPDCFVIEIEIANLPDVYNGVMRSESDTTWTLAQEMPIGLNISSRCHRLLMDYSVFMEFFVMTLDDPHIRNVSRGGGTARLSPLGSTPLNVASLLANPLLANATHPTQRIGTPAIPTVGAQQPTLNATQLQTLLSSLTNAKPTPPSIDLLQLEALYALQQQQQQQQQLALLASSLPTTPFGFANAALPLYLAASRMANPKQQPSPLPNTIPMASLTSAAGPTLPFPALTKDKT